MAKNLKRRGLALLMTIIMSISLLPINVMAEGDADSAGSASQTEESVSGDSSASTGDAATGDTSTGDAATGDTSTGDAATGDTSTGDAATDDTSTGDAATDDTSTGDAATDDTSTGDAATGDTSTGDAATGDTSTGDAATGDTSTGDAATGDTSTGDAATGDTSTGDAATGDTSTGDTGTVTDPAAPVTPVSPVTPADPAAPAVPEKTPEELAKEEADRLAAEVAAKAEAERLAAEAAAKAEAERLAAEKAAFEAAHAAISVTYEDKANDMTVTVNAPVGAFETGTEVTVNPILPEKVGVFKTVVNAIKSMFGAEVEAPADPVNDVINDVLTQQEGTESDTLNQVSYDITFRKDSVEVQPAEGYSVGVQFTAAEDSALSVAGEMRVYHITDGETGLNEEDILTASSVVAEPVEASQIDNGVAVVADSFSIYVVSVKQGNKNQNIEITAGGTCYLNGKGKDKNDDVWVFFDEQTNEISASNPPAAVDVSAYFTLTNTSWSGDKNLVIKEGTPNGTYYLYHAYTDGWWNEFRYYEIFKITVNLKTGELNFDRNDGSVAAPAKQVAAVGSQITLPNYTGTKTGYVFSGWSLNRNANGDGQYKPENNGIVYPVDSKYIVPDGKVTLYAVWSAQNTSAQFFVRLDGTIPTEPQGHDSSEYTDAIDIAGALKVATFYTNSTNPGVANMLNKQPINEQIKAVYRAYNPDTQYVLWYVIKPESTWHVDGVVLDKAKVNLAYNANTPAGLTFVNGTMPDGAQYISGASVKAGAHAKTNTVRIPELTGYTFTGWNTAADGSGAGYASSETFTITADTTLYAQWKADSDTKYVVEHYLQKLEGTGYTLEESTAKYGVTGKEVTATANEYVGFTENTTIADRVATGIIKADGSLVLKLYYTRNSYPVTYTLGTKPSDAPDVSTFGEKFVKYGTSVDVHANLEPSNAKNGNKIGTWTFLNWSSKDATIENGKFVMPAKPVTISGSYQFAVAGTYGVSYADGMGKLVKDVEGRETGETYTVLNYDNTKLNFSKPGWDFAGWTNDAGKTNTVGETATSDKTATITYTAQWTARNDTKYAVEYYQQNATGVGYTLDGTGVTKEGTTDTEASVTPNENRYEHFTYNESKSTTKGTITGDGKLTLKLYYDRETYTVRYLPGEHGTFTETSQQVRYGVNTPAAPVTSGEAGYTFKEWTPEVAATVTASVDYTAQWKADEHNYKVEFYYQDATTGQYPATTTKFDTRKAKTAETVQVTNNDQKPTEKGYKFDNENTNNVLGGKIPATSMLTLKVYFAREFGPDVIQDASFVIHKQDQAEKPMSGVTFTMTPDAANEATKTSTWNVITGDNGDVTVTIDKAYLGSKDSYSFTLHEMVPTGFDGAQDYTITVKKGTVRVELQETADKAFFAHIWDWIVGADKPEWNNATKTLTVTNNAKSYKVEYVYDETAPEGAVLPKSESHQYGEEVTKTAPTTVPGYQFNGWVPSNEGGFAEVDGKTTMPAHNVKFTGSWTANSGTAYTVEYYYEMLDGKYPDEASETVTPAPSGTTGEAVNVTDLQKSHDGFKYDHTTYQATGKDASTTALPIAGDGSLVIKLYYTRNSYKVTYAVTGDKPSDFDETSIPLEKSYPYGTVVNVADLLKDSTAKKDGVSGKWSFTGWKTKNLTENPTSGESFTVNGNVAFTGNYQFTKNGTFTVVYQDGTTTKDGGTYDTGKLYTVLSAEKAGFSNPGYHFDGWTNDAGKTNTVGGTDTSEVTATITYTAKWAANTDTKYTVEYYYQNADGSYPTTVGDENRAVRYDGITDQLASVKDSDKTTTQTGYVYDSTNAGNVSTGTVTGDGSLVLKVYFKQQFTVTYKPGDHGNFDAIEYKTLDCNAATPTAPAASDNNGYTFKGWNDGTKTYPTTADLPEKVTKSVTYTAQWEATAYTINIVLDTNDFDGSAKKAAATVTIPVTVENLEDTLKNADFSKLEFEGATLYKREAEAKADGKTVSMLLKNPSYVGLNVNGKEYGLSGNAKPNMETVKIKLLQSKDHQTTLTFTFDQIVHLAVNYKDGTDVTSTKQIFNTNGDAGLSINLAPTKDNCTLQGWTLNGKKFDFATDCNKAFADGKVLVKQAMTLKDNGFAANSTDNDGIDEIWYTFETQWNPNLIITKTFSGVSALPENFQIVVEGQGTAYTLGLNESDDVQAPDANVPVVMAATGNTYTWTLPGLPTGEYKLVEKNYNVNGYSLQVTDGNGEQVKDYSQTITASNTTDAKNAVTFANDYSVNSHAVSYLVDGKEYKPGTDYAGSFAFGTVVLYAPDYAPAGGYTFSGWYSDKDCTQKIGEASFSMPDKDVTIYGKTTANAHTGYTVQHYQQNLDGGYALADTDNLSGTTGASVIAAPKTYTGFTENKTHADRVASGAVEGDNSLVLKLYYDRETYKVTYTYVTTPAGASALPETVTYRFGETVPVATAATAPNYIFTGWVTPADVTVENGSFTMPASDVTLKGDFKAVVTPTPTPNPGPGNDPGYGPGETPSVVIPDTNTPTTDIPDVSTPTTEIPDEDVPLTEIPDEATPLALAPATGDNIILWVMAAAVSGLGLVWIAIAGKKRRDNNAQ